VIVFDAFRAGARGIFSEYESLETLRKCVRVVLKVKSGPPAGRCALRWRRYPLFALSGRRVADGLHLLTRREQQVASLLAEGLANREIADRLGLGRHTIKNYFMKIFDMGGVSNRVELLVAHAHASCFNNRAMTSRSKVEEV